jgi:hypothetical protein
MLPTAAVARRFGLGSLALLLLIGPVIARWPRGSERADPIRVLFIGNSFTYYYELPRLVAALAEAGRQRPLYFEQETPGGYTLEQHWKAGRALARIQSARWDYVVLQDQSQAPLLNRRSMNEYARKFDAQIKQRGATTILYMTWAARNRPADQRPISTAYEQLSSALPARLAPVGNAWQAALAADRNLVLHDPDQKHPNATGSYLAACVFYATLYGQSPEGLPGGLAGLTDRAARPLQTIAWTSVQAARSSAQPAADSHRSQAATARQ